MSDLTREQIEARIRKHEEWTRIGVRDSREPIADWLMLETQLLATQERLERAEAVVEAADECSACNGKGTRTVYPNYDPNAPCGACDGSGKRPTREMSHNLIVALAALDATLDAPSVEVG